MATGKGQAKRDPAQLIGEVARADVRVAVWCLAQCARTVARYLPENDPTLLAALEAGEGWVRGEVDAEACQNTWSAAFDGPTYRQHRKTRMSHPSYSAARAAMAPAGGVNLEPQDDVAVWFAKRVEGVILAEAQAAANAGYLRASSEGPDASNRAAETGLRRGLTRHRAALDRLVDGLRWPATVPTTAELERAPSPLRAAWDRAADAREIGMTELVEAHRRATQARLDWNDRVQRAIAERVEDPAALAALAET